MIVYNIGNKTSPATRHFDLSHLKRFHVANWRSDFMDMPTSLSMEQQFKLQVLRDQVKSLSQDQAQEYLIEVMRQNMVKENLLKYWMKKF